MEKLKFESKFGGELVIGHEIGSSQYGLSYLICFPEKPRQKWVPTNLVVLLLEDIVDGSIKRGSCMDNLFDITSTEATGVQERACNYPCWSSISESYTTPIVPIFRICVSKSVPVLENKFR